MQPQSSEKREDSVHLLEPINRGVSFSPTTGLSVGGLFGSPNIDRIHFGGGGPGNWWYRKLDMPIFDGTDPDGWVLRVDRYFNFYRLTEEERLEAVVVALEGDAL